VTKVLMASLGCAKNLVDTEGMLGIITQNGLQIVDDESEADVIIINTCCFINDAKQESIDTILELAKWKIEGKCKRLIVTGCMAQRYKDEIIKELPEVDAVVGVGSIADIVSVIDSGENNILCDKQYSHLTSERIRTTPIYTAYLKVADGCDNHCTYCVIPSIRGKYTSRTIEDIVCEAENLAKNGVKELIIIAQDTTNYGMDIYGHVRLCELLNKLCEIEGIKWVRLHYCYPERITDELINTIAKNEKICNYIDIPIQHCNDDILRKMGRRGNKAQLTQVISKLRTKIQDITIRTSVITGFPTETDEQFAELQEFVENMKFDRLGIFTYSQEEETVAAEMEGQIDEEVKRSRLEMLMFAQAEVADEISNAKIGRTLTVLVEDYDSIIKQHFGRSVADSIDIDGKVFFKSKTLIPAGEFVEVTIDEAMDYDLFGTLNSK